MLFWGMKVVNSSNQMKCLNTQCVHTAHILNVKAATRVVTIKK
jgi:hypothetical protein